MPVCTCWNYRHAETEKKWSRKTRSINCLFSCEPVERCDLYSRGITVPVATVHRGILRISFNSRYSFILLCVTVSQMQLYSKCSFHTSRQKSPNYKRCNLALAFTKSKVPPYLHPIPILFLMASRSEQKRQHALHVSHGFEKRGCKANWTRRAKQRDRRTR